MDREDFLKQAADSTERLKAGKARSILEGVPIAIKDEIDALPYSTNVGTSFLGQSAAVAAGYCPAAIGADGGGSIRIPSALCGITGLKPTFGRVSERGAAPLCWSLAHIGPIAATARDASFLYAVIAGKDTGEALTMHQPEPELEKETGIKGLHFGIYPEWFYDCDDSIHNILKETINQLENMGAEIVEIDIPELEEMRIAHLSGNG